MRSHRADRAAGSLDRVAVAGLGLALLATACVGSVDREAFDRIVRERGGGLSQQLVIDAVDALEAEIGVEPLVVERVVAGNEHVTITAVNPDFPDERDRYTYRGDDLDGPDPVNQGPQIELPEGVELPPAVQELIDGAGGPVSAGDLAGTFPIDSVALDQLNAMVDQAIEVAGLRDGYADLINIGDTGNGPRVNVSVTNDRRDVTVTFGPGGALEETR